MSNVTKVLIHKAVNAIKTDIENSYTYRFLTVHCSL